MSEESMGPSSQKWIISAQYPNGEVVEEFDTEERAFAAFNKHVAKKVLVAVRGPAEGSKFFGNIPPRFRPRGTGESP